MATSDVFQLFLFHGGFVLHDGEKPSYISGQVEILEGLTDRDVSLAILKEKIRTLGYPLNGTRIYYAKILENLVKLVLLKSERDVRDMVNEIDSVGILEIWIEIENDRIEPQLVDVKVDEEPGSDTDLEWETEGFDVHVECLDSDKESEDDNEHEPLVKPTAFSDDYVNFSDDASLHDSDSDVDSMWETFRPSTDMKNPNLHLGLTFASKKQFKEAVENYALKNGKAVKCIKNDKKRYNVKCLTEGCPWKIGLRKVMNSTNWVILKMIKEHKDCAWTYENPMVKSSLVAKRWTKAIKDNPNWMMKHFRDKVSTKEGFHVSPMQAYRAIWKAKRQIEGDDEEHFKKLWSYIDEIGRTNPGSSCYVKLSDLTPASDEYRFLRIYLCWEGCKQGFKHCRPIIGVDGCHLKSSLGGMLLTAVGVDANDSIFPIAYAIVEGEKKESWGWFLQNLKGDLNIRDDNENQYTFISDKQKGLLPAFVVVIPGVEHRFCVRHLHGNFKVAGFQGKALKDAVWNCARATTKAAYIEGIMKLRELDEGAYQWLGDKEPTEWSRSHFSSTSKCDILVNNICESFNASILEARDKPIIACVEIIRKMIMTKLFAQREAACQWKTQICPRIVGKLKAIEKKGAKYLATQCDHYKFEVTNLYGDQQEVDLEKHSCSCRVWDLTGIPCKHAVCAIWKKCGKGSVADYVHPCYSKETYMNIYGGCINPMAGPNEWPPNDRTPPLPPLYSAKVGRPKKLRKKCLDELTKDGISVARNHIPLHCSLCRLPGHNARTCPTNPKIKPKKKVIYSTNQMSRPNNAQVQQPANAPPEMHVPAQQTQYTPEELQNLFDVESFDLSTPFEEVPHKKYHYFTF